MAVVHSDVVEIDGEVYRLSEVPSESSKAVLQARISAVDLKTLVDDLGRVGEFIRLAYNNVRAAGPKSIELQLEVQDVRYAVTRLIAQSNLTISKMKKASATILSDIQATHEFLFDNLEEVAIEILALVEKTCRDLEKAAMTLYLEFSEVKMKAEKLLNTLRANYEEAQRTEIAVNEMIVLTNSEFFHRAIEALKQLSALTLQAVQFWKQMRDHCKTLAEAGMKDTVEKGIMKYQVESRLTIWTSWPFKIRAILFIAGWVALNSVCGEYSEYIKPIQKGLCEQLCENPTYEESRQLVKSPDAKFVEDFLKAREQLGFFDDY